MARKSKSTPAETSTGPGFVFSGLPLPFDHAIVGEPKYLSIDNLEPSPFNARKRPPANEDQLVAALAASIVARGLLQPLLVRPAGLRYEVIAGDRRRRAIALAIGDGRLPDDYPVDCRAREMSDSEAYLASAAENLAREDMDPLDEAEAFQMLLPHVIPPEGQTAHAAIGMQYGRSESTVFRRLALLRTAPSVQAALRQGEITLAQGQALALGDRKEQEQVLKRIKDQPELGTHAIKRLVTADRENVSKAIFKIDQYKGEIVTDPDTGDRYFADPVEFDQLTHAILEAKATALRRKWKWVEICEGNFWELFSGNDGSRAVAPDDPDAGGVVEYSRHSGKVEIHAPVLRKSVLAARAKAKHAEETGTPAGSADPLTKGQQETLHIAKTRTLRQAVVDSGGLGGSRLAEALICLGLLGAREIRIGATDYNSAMAISSGDAPHDHIGHLLEAVRSGSAEDYRTSAHTLSYAVNRDPVKYLDALMAAPQDTVYDLMVALAAERIGSWWLPGDTAAIGDTNLAVAIAFHAKVARVDQAQWAPDEAWFKAYGKDRLVDLARPLAVADKGLNIRGMKKGELVKLLVDQPSDFWRPEMFPELAFQTEAQARKALAGQPEAQKRIGSKAEAETPIGGEAEPEHVAGDVAVEAPAKVDELTDILREGDEARTPAAETAT